MAKRRFQSNQSSPRRHFYLAALGSLLCAGLVVLLPYLAKGSDKGGVNDPQKGNSAQPSSLKGLPPTDLTEDQAIVHALNRLGYGPRPGDVQRIKEMGIAKWIDRQLRPESINDSAAEARLSRFSTLSMSSAALLEKFPRPAVAAKREGITPQEYRKQQQEKLQAARQAAENRQGADGQQQMTGQTPGQPNDDVQQNESMTPSRSPQQGGNNSSPQTMAPDELAEILLPGAKNIANQNGPGNRPGAPTINFDQMQAPQRIIAELAMAKMDRAVYTEKQLYEQMVDFWFNHFNVFAGKGADRWLLSATPFARTPWANSATSWRPRQKALPCSFIWITGRASIRKLGRGFSRNRRRAALIAPDWAGLSAGLLCLLRLPIRIRPKGRSAA
jgi:hypothetical protein